MRESSHSDLVPPQHTSVLLISYVDFRDPFLCHFPKCSACMEYSFPEEVFLQSHISAIYLQESALPYGKENYLLA